MFGLSACSSSKLTTWKDKSAERKSVNKVLVVCIINDSALQSRKIIEDQFVQAMNSIGSRAVSALNEFGAGGLLNMEQAETYLKLCNRGIDAVLTIAVLDIKKAEHLKHASRNYSSVYYYNRIWAYKSILAEENKTPETEPDKLFLETIFFKLSTLTPIYWAHRNTFNTSDLKNVAQKFTADVTKDLEKLKVIDKKGTEAALEARTF